MGIFRSTDPTVFDDVDGIIINESAPAPNIAGVAANIAILVGQTQRGPTALTEVGSIGELFELYGKDDSYGVNISLKNKKLGRLKIIRALAADAVLASKAFAYSAVNRLTFSAKQGKGAYGNNILVKIEEGSNSLQPEWSVDCVADESDSLDGKYFILRDKAGTVAFWIDTDNSGTSEPSHGATRGVEITTIATDDNAATVATKIAAAIDADGGFSAEVDGDDNSLVLVTAVDFFTSSGTGAGNSGFTVTTLEAGVAGKKYTIRDNNANAVHPDEIYDNIQIGNIAGDTPFANSILVTVVVNSAAFEPTNAAFTNLASGSDGTIANSDYETAIALAEVENAGNFILLDSYNATRIGYLKTHIANTQDKMAITCGAEGDSVSAAVADVASYRDTAGRIIYAYPWVQTTIGGVNTWVNPASWLASILTQTSPHIDPAYIKNADFLAGITDLKTALSRSNYVALKEAGICAFERTSVGLYKPKSGIVTQISDSSKVTILRRRMADFLTSSVGEFLQNYQNAPNTAENRKLVKGAILTFVNSLEGDGILPRDSEVSSGKAKLVDTESLNTNTAVALGFFKILWRQRIHSAMRFIVLQAEIGESVVVTEQAS
jgi:hypothetical protein